MMKKNVTISKYEFLNLIRSTALKYLTVIVLIVITVLGKVLFLSPLRIWDWFAAPSVLPYLSTLITTFLLCIASVFLGADILKQDRSLDTLQALHSRPVFNYSFIVGRILALLVALGIILTASLVVTLVINSIADDLPIQWAAYFWYPLLMTLPAITFTTGLTFFLTLLSGSSILGPIVAIVFILVSLAVPLESIHHPIDLTGFHIPFIYSDIVGFGDFLTLILQRGMFLIFGIGLISASVLLYPRLHSRHQYRRWFGSLTAVCTMGGIFIASLLVSSPGSGARVRERMREMNIQYASIPVVTVTACDLDVVHLRSSIKVNAAIRVKNATDTPLDSYIFSLNPGLNVESVTCNGVALQFQHNMHILDITPHKLLGTDETDNITIAYHGSIDENACYTDIDEKKRLRPYGFSVFDIAKRYAFIESGFVLLTAETLWYPVAGVPFGSLFPASQKRDFVTFELSVTTDDRLVVLSQGNATSITPGITRFTPETPLPALSLVIGEYEVKSVVVDSTTYSVYLQPGHDVFTSAFQEFRGEKLVEWIRSYRSDIESLIERSFPYKQFSIVEVPIQFYAYMRLWSGEMQTVPPEMALVPEKGYSCFRPYGDFTSAIKNREIYFHQSSTREDIEEIILSNFLAVSIHRIDYGYDLSYHGESDGLFLAKTRARDISFGLIPHYSLFQLCIYPIDTLVFPSFIERYQSYKVLGTNYTINRATSRFLEDRSLEMIIGEPSLKKIVPFVLRTKSDEFFAILETKIGEQELRETINDIINSNSFICCSFDSIESIFKEKHNFNLSDEILRSFRLKGLPGFVITDKKSRRIEQGDRTYHQVEFTLHNLEQAQGLVHLRGIDAYRMGEGHWATYTTTLSGKQSKEITMVFDDSPQVQIEIHTFLSKNIPNRFLLVSRVNESSERGMVSPGERIILEQYTPVKHNEIVVDNEDPGFEIVNSHSQRIFIQSLFKKEDEPIIFPFRFHGYGYEHYPGWRYITNGELYGLYAKTAYIISSGNNDACVRWTANLPQEGEYDLYYYSYYFDLNSIMPPSFFDNYPNFKGIPTVGDYHFIVHDSSGAQNITVNMPGNFMEEYPMEAYIGTFTFKQGKATVELTGETNGVYIFADAVKWVKK